MSVALGIRGIDVEHGPRTDASPEPIRVRAALDLQHVTANGIGVPLEKPFEM